MHRANPVRRAASSRRRRRRTHNRRQVGRPQLPLAELQGARRCFWACAHRLHVQVGQLAVALTCVFIQEVPHSLLCSEASPWALGAHAASSGPQPLASQERPQEPSHGRSHLGLETRSHSPGRANQTRKEMSRPGFRNPSNEEKRTKIDPVIIQLSPLSRPFRGVGKKWPIAKENPRKGLEIGFSVSTTLLGWGGGCSCLFSKRLSLPSSLSPSGIGARAIASLGACSEGG